MHIVVHIGMVASSALQVVAQGEVMIDSNLEYTGEHNWQNMQGHKEREFSERVVASSVVEASLVEGEALLHSTEDCIFVGHT